MRIFRLISVLGIFLATGQSLAQVATFDGQYLSIPIVDIGDQSYSYVLEVSNSDPVEIDLVDRTLLTEASGELRGALTKNVLAVPAIVVNGVTYFAEFVLIEGEADRFRLFFADIVDNSEEKRLAAEALFNESIADPIIQSKCIVCHVDGGVARDTNLVYQSSNASSSANNLAAIDNFLLTRSDAAEYMLSKVSGGDGHGGGIQLPSGSTDYDNLASLLGLLTDSATTQAAVSPQPKFFDGVSLLSNVDTLYRAAVILAGRRPTSAEVNQVQNGTDEDLRAALRNMMQGDGFHSFIVEGANDRLLLRGIRDVNLLDDGNQYPLYRNARNDETIAILNESYTWNFALGVIADAPDLGIIEGAYELIHHVASNELPYSEILTADYFMFNPYANQYMGGTAVFDNPTDANEYKPGVIGAHYLEGRNADGNLLLDVEEVPEINGRYVYPNEHSVVVDYPHAGILNSLAFLKRYPTTATNRNRARARWTFLHFLDIDIERSAPRTTDPVALADTNNPTMFNENCTVCHSTMDPVAGAFQNYGDDGYYRSAWGGTDSLDDFYKNPEDGSDSPYQEGDVWYRDMREPGIYGLTAPDNHNSVQWLAQQIVKEPGFGRATVKFWWPAVMGSEVLKLPEVETDVNYSAQLAAYDAQNNLIEELADDFFYGGMNLKDLLVEMMMSKFFRALSTDESQTSDVMLEAHELANLGSEKLLTPERLVQKTQELTGHTWRSRRKWTTGNLDTGLGEYYRLYYGGINSDSVTERSTEMTPLMNAVAQTHALESACGILTREFTLPDGQRKLFNGISGAETPETNPSKVREKIVELHHVLLGRSFASDSEEINDAYELFVDTWQWRRENAWTSVTFEGETCPYWFDEEFFEGTPIDPAYRTVVPATGGDYPYYSRDYDIIGEFIAPARDDPYYTKQAWIVMLIYLMTHYYYLYE